MSLLPNTLTFGETRLAIIDRHGEPWLTARELARALAYQDESAVLRIYARNQDEFTEEMTCTVKLTVPSRNRRTDGGPQETRVFSTRGCHLIAMLSRTVRAKAFRRWVLDVLETHVRGSGEACRLMPLLGLTRKRWGYVYSPTGFNAISLNAALVLDYLLEHFDDGQWHTMSLRDLSDEIDIPKSSVQKVLVRLDKWGLISRDGGSRGVPGELRVHSRKIRQQLKQGSLNTDDQLPWLH